MELKKKYIPGLILAVLCFLAGLNTSFAECFVLAGISLVLNLRKKEQYRTYLNIVFTVLGIILGIYGMIVFIDMCRDPNISADYWLYKLIMK